MRRYRTLIVEDHVEHYITFAQIITSMYEFQFIDIGVCTVASNTCDLIKHAEPDIIFLDHNLTENGGEGLEILLFIKKNFPQCIVISTTDMNVENHGWGNTLRLYEEYGHHLISTSKEADLVRCALQSLSVFVFHDERPQNVYGLFDGMRSPEWNGTFAKMGLQSIPTLSESCLVLINVSPHSHGGPAYEKDGWEVYVKHSLPPINVVNNLYQYGHKCVIVEVSVSDTLPPLHALEHDQIDLFDIQDFLTTYTS